MKTFVPLFAMILMMTAPVKAQRSFNNNDPITKKVILSGNIRDKKSGETLIGATLYIKELKTGGVTDVNGNYSVELPKGVYTLSVSYTGYQTLVQNLELFTPMKYNFELEPRNVDIH